MFKKMSSIVEYVSWLYKINSENQQMLGNVFRIVNTENNKFGEHILDIQVINKATIFRCTAKEIAARDSLLECFSKQDIRVITYLATKDLFVPKTKIVSEEYDSDLQRTIFNIKSSNSDELTQLTVDKIALNKNILKDMSQEDAHKAGYHFAIEQLLLEKAAIENMNKPKCKETN